jgi:hypothetical protein
MAGEALSWKSSLFFHGAFRPRITGRAERPPLFRLIQNKGIEKESNAQAGIQISSRSQPVFFIPFGHSFDSDLSPPAVKAELTARARKDAADAGKKRASVDLVPRPTSSPPALPPAPDTVAALKDSASRGTAPSTRPEKRKESTDQAGKKAGSESVVSPATHPHLYYFSRKQKKWKRRDEADFDLTKIRPLRKKATRKRVQN